MLKLFLAQRIPLSQFCSINHGFLFKYRKLCLELPSILSCQSNLVCGGIIFERFKKLEMNPSRFPPFLCRVRSIWIPSPEKGVRLGRSWERQWHQEPPALCPGGEIPDPPWSPSPFSWRVFCTPLLRRSFPPPFSFLSLSLSPPPSTQPPVQESSLLSHPFIPVASQLAGCVSY